MIRLRFASSQLYCLLMSGFGLHAPSLTAQTAQNYLISNVEGNAIINHSIIGTDLLWDAGYFGLGINIANVEAGHVWSEHEVFNRSAIGTALGQALPASPARLINAPVSSEAPELGEVDFHATMVGHVLVGAGNVTNTNGSVHLTNIGTGMAPLATLWSGAIATHFGKTPETTGSFSTSAESFRTPYVEFFTGATGPKADVINSSWGFDDADDQSTRTRIISALAYENPEVASVFAAGNSGSGTDQVNGPARSLNGITVGSVGGAQALTPSVFSSGGPVSFFDRGTNQLIAAARAAVHVAAPGENLALAAYLQPTGGLEPLLNAETTSTEKNLYFNFSASGTSFAAPTVAGGIGLLKDFIKTGPYGLPQTQALDTRVIRSVIMASALRTEGWNNGQTATGPGGSILTTQALDYVVGAGRFDVAQAALLFVQGTADVAGTDGGTALDPKGWDYGALAFGEVNDYTLNLSSINGLAEITVSLNWFLSEHYNPATGDTTAGSFANLDLEVWQLNASGDFQTLLAASRTLYNTSEFLRFLINENSSLGLRVGYQGLIYDFDNLASGDLVDYGLAWTISAIPEPATAAWWLGLGVLGQQLVGRRSRRAKNQVN